MSKVKHDCKKQGCYLERVATWFHEVVDPCMPGIKEGSDPDYWLERKGNLLVIETKSSNKHTLPQGQRILFEESTKRSKGGIAVYVVYREKGRTGGPVDGEVLMVQTVWKGVFSELKSCSIQDFQDMVKRWYRWADSQPKC